MNPFSMPTKIMAKGEPQDMRAGIERLAACVASQFDRDVRDETMYVFLSKDKKKVKLLRFQGDMACLWYVRSFKGRFPIFWDKEGLQEIDMAKLLIFLRGEELKAAPETYRLS